MSTFKVGDSAIMNEDYNNSFLKDSKVKIIELNGTAAYIFNGRDTALVPISILEPLTPAKQKISPRMELILGLTVWFVHAFFTFLITLMIPIPWSFRIGLSLIIGHFSAQLSNLVNSKK